MSHLHNLPATHLAAISALLASPALHDLVPSCPEEAADLGGDRYRPAQKVAGGWDWAAGGLDLVGGGLDFVGAPMLAPAMGAAPALMRHRIPAPQYAAAPMMHPAVNPALAAQAQAARQIALANQLGVHPSELADFMDRQASARTGVSGVPQSYKEVLDRATSTVDFDITATAVNVAANSPGQALAIAPVAMKPTLISVPDPTERTTFRLLGIQIGRVTYRLSGGPGGGTGVNLSIYNPDNNMGGRRVQYDDLTAGQQIIFDVVNTTGASASITFFIGCAEVRRKDALSSLFGR